MAGEDITLHGRLAPVDWPGIEAFARLMSDFARVHVTPDHVVTVSMDAGAITLRWAAGAADIRLQARDQSAAQNLRDTLGHLLDSAVDGLAAGLSWPTMTEGALPPNFRLATVEASTRLSPNFLRLRLRADDLGFMARTGLHLRLLQPKDPANPVWPRLSATGRTVWPDSGLLHMPVYTIRAIDAASGWLDVDIYLHGRGRTCAWAKAARPGDPVGISGPGGGWLPKGAHLVLGGDETALPVIGRILSEAAPDTIGRAVIAVTNLDDRQEISGPPGVQIDWLGPQDRPKLATTFDAIASTALSGTEAVQVLFGGERLEADHLRHTLRKRFHPSVQRVAVATYWRADTNA
jgi:NADPH-dependent ferric siderophore reductase